MEAKDVVVGKAFNPDGSVGEIHVVGKGWGYEIWCVNKQEYCGKLLHFHQGKSCSWHKHLLKDETFYVAKGQILIKYGWDDDREKASQMVLNEGDTFYIPVGLRHQMTGLVESDMYEFSTQHFDSDSIRIEKGD